MKDESHFFLSLLKENGLYSLIIYDYYNKFRKPKLRRLCPEVELPTGMWQSVLQPQ